MTKEEFQTELDRITWVESTGNTNKPIYKIFKGLFGWVEMFDKPVIHSPAAVNFETAELMVVSHAFGSLEGCLAVFHNTKTNIKIDGVGINTSLVGGMFEVMIPSMDILSSDRDTVLFYLENSEGETVSNTLMLFIQQKE